MKKISLYYYNDLKNFGDILNVDLIKKVFGIEPVYDSLYSSKLVAIGSLLESFLHGSSNTKLLAKRILLPTLYIWGTGFISAENTRVVRPHNQHEVFFRNVRVFALRGSLTKIRIEKMYSKDLKIAVGDPGLLSSRLLTVEKPEKRYRLGIIPHYVDKDNPLINVIHSNVNNSCIIDIFDNPQSFLNNVSQCEAIVSSAMHGLIASDSLGIPNARLILSDDIAGGNYKFDDYYSAFNIFNHNRIDFRNSKFDIGKINSTINEYNINKEKVKRIQNELVDAFNSIKEKLC